VGGGGREVAGMEGGGEGGGLASGFTVEGLSFDYGPYILLDRPGLEWSFQQFGEDLSRHLELRRIDEIYRVTDAGGAQVNFYSDAERTASEFEQHWPGSAKRYAGFVQRTNRVYKRLSGLLHVAHPTVIDLLRSGAWTQAGFLLRSLQDVLSSTGLPPAIVNAIGIWTHVAGHTLSEAPSQLAFVPGLFHTVGRYLPLGGIRRVAQVMTMLAVNSGVKFEFNCRVKRIRTQARSVKAVETEKGGLLEADVIISNHSAIGTYFDLLDQRMNRRKESELAKLPLQSPGV